MAAEIDEGAQHALEITRQKHGAGHDLDPAPGAQLAQFLRATNEEPVLEMDARHFLGERLRRRAVALRRAAGETECRARPDEAVRLSGR